jgi:hypothetical protein
MSTLSAQEAYELYRLHATNVLSFDKFQEYWNDINDEARKWHVEQFQEGDTDQRRKTATDFEALLRLDFTAEREPDLILLKSIEEVLGPPESDYDLEVPGEV